MSTIGKRIGISYLLMAVLLAVIGGAGLIVPEGDVTALAHALRRLLQDDELRHDLAGQGRARVEAHFTQAQIAAQTVDVYREMLGA